MRFIVSDERDVSLSVLEAALKKTDPSYVIERDKESDSEGEIMYEGAVYGQMEVNRVDEEIFDEEIEELKEFIN